MSCRDRVRLVRHRSVWDANKRHGGVVRYPVFGGLSILYEYYDLLLIVVVVLLIGQRDVIS